MLISELEGLKFPDIYVIRFFFKQGLNKIKGKVLEFGCGNGNNLMMFYQYGWEVTGVDNNENSIKQAKNNLDKCQVDYGLRNTFEFFVQDMLDFSTNYKGCSFDLLLLPSVIYYLAHNQILEFFYQIRKNKLVTNNSLIFIRTRGPRDYRYGKGEKLGDGTFKLNIKETGEYGCLNTFLTESELINILGDNLVFEYKHIFHCDFDNCQRDRLISNSDIILWGKIKEVKKL